MSRPNKQVGLRCASKIQSRRFRAISEVAAAVVEAMEPRRLLAGITVNGTANPDTIIFNSSSYTLNGVTTPILASITGVVFNGRGGAETISISATPATRPVTLNGGTGTDAINIGNGDLDTILANVTVNGGALADNDLLTINNSSDQITATDESWIVRVGSMETDERTFSYNNVARVVANQSGNSSFNSVREIAAGMSVTINANAGNDMFEVGDNELNPTGGVVNNIRGTLNINAGTQLGTGQGDSFSFNNFNAVATTSYVLTNTTFTSPAVASFRINYGGFEDMNLNLSAAAERFDATTRTGAATWLLGGGADTIFGTAAGDVLEAGDANIAVEIHGGEGLDNIIGSDMSDRLFGDAGDDLITPGFGFDTINGGAGSDTVEGADANDTNVFTPATAPETDVFRTTILLLGGLDFSAITTPVFANLQNLFPDIDGFIVDFASHANRSLNFEVSIDTGPYDFILVNGGSGNDDLTGGSQTTFLRGNAGYDIITGGPNTFDIRGGADNDTLTLTSEFGLLAGDGGNDLLIGTAFSDTINGGEGNDTLVGNGGEDDLSGGTGDDTYVFKNVTTAAEPIKVFEFNGEGIDTLDFSLVTVPVRVSLFAPTIADYGNQIVQGTEFENAIGGSGNDTVEGDNGNNFLDGGGGNDTLNGFAGNDRYRGGLGNDPLIAGEGNDILIGDEGNDTYRFPNALASQTDTIIEFGDATGIDALDFSTSNQPVDINLNSEQAAFQFDGPIVRNVVNIFNDLPSRIENATGGSSQDSIIGSDGPNLLSGGGSDDTILGGFGNDTLVGGAGNDSLFGEFGNDQYRFANAAASELDLIDEASDPNGVDLLDFTAVTTLVDVNLGSDGIATHLNREVVTITGGSFVNIEQATGGSAGDFIRGNASNNTLTGGPGSDTLIGFAGADAFCFGNVVAFEKDFSADSIQSDLKDDILDFSPLTTSGILLDLSKPIADPANPNPGEPLLLIPHANRSIKMFNSTVDRIFNVRGTNQADTITGNTGNNILIGGAGADSLTGNTGSNSLVGDAGIDTLVGGEGSDTLVGGADNDIYRFAAAAAAQTDRINEASGGGTDTLDFATLTTAVTVNLSADTLATHANRVVKTSTAGLFVNLENALGGSGSDSITGNAKDNNLTGNGGNDTLMGLVGNDKLTGGTGLDKLFGGDNNDTLFGADGATDTLDGGTGVDVLGSSDASDIKVSIP